MYTYEELKSFVRNCSRCPLSKTRHNAVMGNGNIKTDIMFVGEAPGFNEDMDGVPFTGASGKLFSKMLEKVGFLRDDIYITNIVKCRPPKNRDPKPSEQTACIDYLAYETLLIKPKMIVCLGRVASQRIIDGNFRITRQHGEFIERKGYYLSATFHPSAVLRDNSKMKSYIEDFMKIRKKYDEIVKNIR